MDKKIRISWIILIVVLISVIVTTIIMGQKKNEVNPNLSPDASQQNSNEENEMNEMSEAYVSINNQQY